MNEQTLINWIKWIAMAVLCVPLVSQDKVVGVIRLEVPDYQLKTTPMDTASGLLGNLISVDGKLVGINTMMAGPDVGMAVPVHVVKAFLKRELGESSV